MKLIKFSRRYGPRPSRRLRLDHESECLDPINKTGMKTRYRAADRHFQPKEANIHVARIQRALDACVGLLWTVAYSLLIERFHAPLARLELENLLFRELALHTYRDDTGAVRANSRFNADTPVAAFRYFVDPETGVLKSVSPQDRARWAEAAFGPATPQNPVPIERKRDGATLQYHKLDGQWYEVEVVPTIDLWAHDRLATLVDIMAMPIDVLLGTRPHQQWNSIQSYGRDGRFGLTKRQISAREIRDLGLNHKPQVRAA